MLTVLLVLYFASKPPVKKEVEILNDTEVHAVSYGGNPAAISGDITKVGDTFKIWVESLSTKELQVLSAIKKCVPVWQFADDEKRQMELEEYFYKHAGNVESGLIYNRPLVKKYTLTVGEDKKPIFPLLGQNPHTGKPDKLYRNEKDAVVCAPYLPEKSQVVELHTNADFTCSIKFLHNNKFLGVKDYSTLEDKHYGDQGQLYAASDEIGDTEKFYFSPIDPSSRPDYLVNMCVKSKYNGKYLSRKYIEYKDGKFYINRTYFFADSLEFSDRQTLFNLERYED